MDPLETVAVCSGGSINHPRLSTDGKTLDGPSPYLRLVGGGIENVFASAGKDNIVRVTDVGEGLCPENNSLGPQIDIFIGEGSQAYNNYFFEILNTDLMQVFVES